MPNSFSAKGNKITDISVSICYPFYKISTVTPSCGN